VNDRVVINSEIFTLICRIIEEVIDKPSRDYYEKMRKMFLLFTQTNDYLGALSNSQTANAPKQKLGIIR